jgi:hypothetical protein
VFARVVSDLLDHNAGLGSGSSDRCARSDGSRQKTGQSGTNNNRLGWFHSLCFEDCEAISKVKGWLGLSSS